MRPITALLATALLVVPASLFGELPIRNINSFPVDPLASESMGAISPSISKTPYSPRPFSLAATSEDLSSLGFRFQFATNLNRHMNLRSSVSMFDFGGQSFSSEGLHGCQTKIHMATTGSSLDIYPFSEHGFRLSPGVLFHNPFLVGSHFIPTTSSFILNGTTYYQSATAPVSGVVTINRDSDPAFTMTTGWGNMIPHKTSRLSFPVEVGVAFIGAPVVKVPITWGQVCSSQGQNCQDVTTDSEFQSDLRAQAEKFGSHLDLLKTYPIVSFGVAYAFHLRPDARW